MHHATRYLAITSLCLISYQITAAFASEQLSESFSLNENDIEDVDYSDIAEQILYTRKPKIQKFPHASQSHQGTSSKPKAHKARKSRKNNGTPSGSSGVAPAASENTLEPLN